MNYIAESLWLAVLVFLMIRILLPRTYKHAEHLMQANIVTKSLHPNGAVARTFHLVFPRMILAEMNTHKNFARSVSSSRAIPIQKMLAQVWNAPFIPISFGRNQKGMQAGKEINGFRRKVLENLWVFASEIVCVVVWIMFKLRLHKQTANRLLEPWLFVHATVTATQLKNFFNLRDHEDAQPEIRYLARLMKFADKMTKAKALKVGDWHLPWITDEDWGPASEWAENNDMRVINVLLRASAARCARSSYANFDTGSRSIFKDMETFASLVDSEPVHASPAEHQLKVDETVTSTFCTIDDNGVYGEPLELTEFKHENLHGHTPGFIVFRNTLPNHFIPG